MSDQIVQAARVWIGTPYRHQASTRGAGCDCLGLLRGVWRDVYGREPEVAPPYTPDWDEVAQRDVLMTAARRHLLPEEVSEMDAGDVLLFRMRPRAVAKHLGILSGPSTFIHAYSGHGVIENTLSAPWRRRVAAVFSFPAID